MKKFGFVVLFICNMALCVLGCSGSRTDSAEAPVIYTDVSGMNEEALKAYEEGEFEESLRQYAEAMKENPIDIDSRIGTIKCQLAMENYDLAQINLSAAFRVEPENETLYDLYIELSEKSNRIFYARQAVELAKTYQVQSFLDKIPSPPELGTPEGEYDNRLELEISAEDGAEIFVSEKKDGRYLQLYKYSMPISITRGVTDLEVYSVKDGIPSEAVTARYTCEYAPVEVTFEDPVFEKIVRAAMGWPQGAVTDAECEEITGLNLYDIRSSGMDYEEYQKQKIYTLSDLYWFPNLEQLYLDGQDTITDFSLIAQCRRLSSLNIRDSGLSDLSFVKDMPNLGYFDVSENGITDLAPLSFCSDLYNLDIAGNPVTDLTPLKDLDILYFSADVPQISDGTVIQGFKNLSSLSLYGCGGFDGSILKGMTKLEQLYLYSRDNDNQKGIPLGDVSFLKELTSLERLSLNGLADYSQISDVTSSLNNLTYLYFRTLDYSEPPQELIEEIRRNLPGCDIRY